MNLRLFIKARLHRLRVVVAQQRILRRAKAPLESFEIRRTDWPLSLQDPTAFYLRAFCHFHRLLPIELREHRRYFAARRRGFGEDTFHSMWFLLHREYRPKRFLEIGVYRGQVLSLMALLQQRVSDQGEIVGISPFSAVGDSVTRYRQGINYLEDTLSNFRRFGLPKPDLLQASSADAAAIDLIKSRPWDCIYIDGNHDYEVAKADWLVCSKSVKPGGLIVLDDAAVTTGYRPPCFGTRGHPGPSRVAAEIVRSEFEEVLQVGHNRVFQRLEGG
jgi:predicted O-methyltransferase YrrM